MCFEKVKQIRRSSVAKPGWRGGHPGGRWLGGPGCLVSAPHGTDAFVPSGPYNKLYVNVHSLVQEMPWVPNPLTSAE